MPSRGGRLTRSPTNHETFPTLSDAEGLKAKWERKSTLWRRLYHYYSYNHEWFMQQYHKRSNVESTFHMIKSKFGDALRSKTETAQVNEALCKVLCHNLCCLIQSMFELNVKPEFWTNDAPLQVN